MMATNNGTVEAFCAACGEDREADAHTGRCTTCGRLATTHMPTRSLSEVRRDAGVHSEKAPSAAYRPVPPRTALDTAIARQQAGMTASRHDSKPAVEASVTPPALTRVRLPNSKPSIKWLEATRALQAAFESAATEAEKKVAELEARIAGQVTSLKAEAVRFRNSARVITQVLEQVGVEAEAAPTTSPVRSKRGPKPAGAWAMHHERCIDCGRTDREHKARGRCTTCDVVWRKRPKVVV